MNTLIIVGIALYAVTNITDRFLYKLPSWLAVVIYGISAILIIAGMIIARKAG